MDTKQIAHEVRLRQWANVLRERKDSGLSIRRWCRENSVGEKTYYYWQRKLRESVCAKVAGIPEPPQVPATFAQIQMPAQKASDGKLIIRIGGAEVEIQGDMPAATIEAVLGALAGR